MAYRRGDLGLTRIPDDVALPMGGKWGRMFDYIPDADAAPDIGAWLEAPGGGRMKPAALDPEMLRMIYRLVYAAMADGAGMRGPDNYAVVTAGLPELREAFGLPKSGRAGDSEMASRLIAFIPACGRVRAAEGVDIYAVMAMLEWDKGRRLFRFCSPYFENVLQAMYPERFSDG